MFDNSQLLGIFIPTVFTVFLRGTETQKDNVSLWRHDDVTALVLVLVFDWVITSDTVRGLLRRFTEKQCQFSAISDTCECLKK